MGRGRWRKIDRLSSLPENLLLHILTLLPVKEAVKTSLVSSTFRNLWAFLPTLFFDFCPYHTCGRTDDANGPDYNEGFFHFVYNLLLLYQGKTIQKFYLKLELNFYFTEDEPPYENNIHRHPRFVAKERRRANAVTTWIIFAMSKKVKLLYLDFMSCATSVQIVPKATYILPMDVFSRGECLRALTLCACQIKLRSDVQVRFSSLRRLCLNEIVLDNNIMDRILCACTVLEELTLLGFYGLSRLAFSNPSIKSLDVSTPDDCERLEIVCPNIVSLVLTDHIYSVDLVDVSSVANATLDCEYGCESESPLWLNVKTLFEKLRQCKNFRACNRCIAVFNKLQQTCLSFEWRYLELEVGIERHLPWISYLLRSSPFLESLDLYICPKYDEFDVDLLHAQYLDSGEFWNSIEGNFHCLQHHLKNVRIYGDVEEPHLIQLIEFVLKNAVLLEKVVISTKKTFAPMAAQKTDLSVEKKLEVCQKLCSLPRAASTCEFLFSW